MSQYLYSQYTKKINLKQVNEQIQADACLNVQPKI